MQMIEMIDGLIIASLGVMVAWEVAKHCWQADRYMEEAAEDTRAEAK